MTPAWPDMTPAEVSDLLAKRAVCNLIVRGPEKQADLGEWGERLSSLWNQGKDFAGQQAGKAQAAIGKVAPGIAQSIGHYGGQANDWLKQHGLQNAALGAGLGAGVGGLVGLGGSLRKDKEDRSIFNSMLGGALSGGAVGGGLGLASKAYNDIKTKTPGAPAARTPVTADGQGAATPPPVSDLDVDNAVANTADFRTPNWWESKSPADAALPGDKPPTPVLKNPKNYGLGAAGAGTVVVAQRLARNFMGGLRGITQPALKAFTDGLKETGDATAVAPEILQRLKNNAGNSLNGSRARMLQSAWTSHPSIPQWMRGARGKPTAINTSLDHLVDHAGRPGLTNEQVRTMLMHEEPQSLARRAVGMQSPLWPALGFAAPFINDKFRTPDLSDLSREPTPAP